MTAATIVQQLVEFAHDLELEYDGLGADRDDELGGNESAEVLAIMLAAARDCRAGLAIFEKRIEADLLTQAGEKRFVVEGLGEVEIRKSIKRNQWDDDGLTRRVVALALDERVCDPETGEYEPAHEAVARVLSECSRPSWRVTPLRARGLQIDEWCVEEHDGYSVQLPPRK